MSDQPKPTCKTCPYFALMDASAVKGQCRRSHPRATAATPQSNGCDDAAYLDGASFWCGDHPAFPAWLAAQSDTPSRHEPDPAREADLADRLMWRLGMLRQYLHAQAMTLSDFEDLMEGDLDLVPPLKVKT